MLENAAEGLPGSKVRKLLSDLKLSEHNVVFTQSKEYIHHLSHVLTSRGIGSCSLFVGQSPTESQDQVRSQRKKS